MSDNKTPWNPSKKAIKRVKNPLPIPTECSCSHDWETGKPSTDCIEIVNNSEIYGREYGEWPWAVQCQICEAYVGLHPYTNIPVGFLGDGPTRKARKNSKPLFNRLFESGKMSRNEAYEALAEKLGIEKEECHFGWFDIDQCKAAEKATREIFLGV